MRTRQSIPFAAAILFGNLAAISHAVPIALDATNPVNRTNGTVRIVLSGENGLQYFIRTTTSLTNNEWKLAQTNGVNGSQTVDVPLTDPAALQSFFRAESAYEQRSRLFITNYQRQLASGGPTVLSVNGVSVQNAITIAEDRTNNQIVITGNGVPNYAVRLDERHDLHQRSQIWIQRERCEHSRHRHILVHDFLPVRHQHDRGS